MKQIRNHVALVKQVHRTLRGESLMAAYHRQMVTIDSLVSQLDRVMRARDRWCRDASNLSADSLRWQAEAVLWAAECGQSPDRAFMDVAAAEKMLASLKKGVR
jgi:hypothetical protein